MMKRKIVVVSLFSGMDLFLLACTKAGLIPGFACERNIFAALMHAANFKTKSGDSVINFIEITKQEYDFRKKHKDENGKKDLEDTTTEKDGKYIRSKSIEEINGFEIRSEIEREYGKNVIIILIGGPPCQDFLAMNKHKTIDENGSRNSRNFLIFEYLRLLSELNPDVALMEQTPKIGADSYEHIFTEFIEKINQLPFKMAFQDINSIHYQGNQSRERRAFIFVNTNLNASPVFPTPSRELAKRVRDFLDIDYFISGHFTDGIKNKNHFMCTVTSGSPIWFRKGKKQWAPSIDELLLCMDVQKGEYIIPSGLPTAQIKKAIGNGVCVSMGHALITSVLENILRLKPDGDGYWIPIDPLPNETIPTCDQLQEAEFELLSENVLVIEPENKSENTSVSDVTPISILPELRNVGLSYKNSKKIISCAQLKTMQFQSLNFQGKWDTFFGLPSISFYCILHGLSGEGKSTFAIQFANYLANNFGKVIYISGEEGFSKTFKDKFIYTSADSVSLEVADLRTYDDIIREVRTETYNFIFIDSLDCMKIDAEKMKKIRATYKNSAIISISQSTKDGQMRGSYEIVHDSDIAVKVENGIATTTKNRFQEKGTTFNVFEEMTAPQINPVNNINNNTNL